MTYAKCPTKHDSCSTGISTSAGRYSPLATTSRRSRSLNFPASSSTASRRRRHHRHTTADVVISELRAAVPAEHLDEFDMLLADARNVMDMRDDNGPLTVEWPTGLLRRALLVAGARLADRGRLAEADHVFELTPDEARRVLTAPDPSASELSARAASAGCEQSVVSRRRRSGIPNLSRRSTRSPPRWPKWLRWCRCR